jgi:t-SNARE complex subunit (syntaxin)
MMGKASGTTSSWLGDGEQPGAFMRQFFQAVGEVQGHIAKGRADVGKMAGTVEVALAATSQAQEREASDILEALTEEVSRGIGAAKEGLKILQERTDQEAKLRPNAQEVKIRNNMQHAMARKHQQLLLEFQRVQTDYKEGLKKRQCRELAILLPESSEEQREEMIQQGETASRVLVHKMAGAHATLIDEVNRIREKHQDILRLEQSIADIAQTFQEMAVLVDAQGEMLDSIEANTRNVKAATAKAETNLKQTIKAQRKHRKYICCLMVVMIILAITIMLPILAKAG